MPSLPFLYTDFHGGLNTKNAPYLLTDDEARDLSNVQGTTAGAIVKRNGLVTFAMPAQPLTSLFALESTASPFLIGTDATNIYSITTSGVLATLKSALTNGRWEFVSAPVVSGQGPLFGMNGTDTPQQWNGSAASTTDWTNASGGAAVPNGRYCIYHQNQVFVAGVTATPSRLYWSAIADPTNWDPASLTGAGFMDFDPNDGEAISGIGRVGPYVLIAKPRKLWILADPATATSRRIADNIGVIAHRSICASAAGTYFLAEDRGVYLTNGTKVTPIADNIQPTIDLVTLRSSAAGACFGGHYYLSVRTGSTNDVTLDYDETLQSWWKHSFGSNQFAVWHPSGTAQLYSAKPVPIGLTASDVWAGSGLFAVDGTFGAAQGAVDQCFVPGVTVDNGVPFTWVWRGPWQSPTFYRRRRFPTPYFRKRLRQTRYDGMGLVDVSMAKDFATVETLLRSDIFNYAAGMDAFAGSGSYAGADGSLFGGQTSFQRARIYTLGVANAFSTVFSATSTAPAELASYVLMITDRKDLVVS